MSNRNPTRKGKKNQILASGPDISSSSNPSTTTGVPLSGQGGRINRRVSQKPEKEGHHTEAETMLATPAPEKQQEEPLKNVPGEGPQPVQTKCEQLSPPPTSDIIDSYAPTEEHHEGSYEEYRPTEIMTSRPGYLSRQQMYSEFFQGSQTPILPPSSRCPSIPFSLTSNMGGESFRMGGIRDTLSPETPRSPSPKELKSSHILEALAAGVNAATQKRKRGESQPQRSPPTAEANDLDSLPEEVTDPLEAEAAQQRLRAGQFAIHSELSGGKVLRNQFAKCKELLGDLGKFVDALTQNSVDAHLNDIHEDIKNFLSSNIECEGIIGFLGEVGAGKSTLLNAVLDKSGFIPTGDEGYCMPVILEFSRCNSEFKLFTMVVTYVGKTQLEEETQFLFEEIEVEQKGGTAKPKGAKVPPKFQKPITRESKATSQRLKHLFPGIKLESLPDVLRQIDELYAKDGIPQTGVLTIHCESEQECAATLRSLTVSPSEKPTAQEKWPIIEKIRVYLDSEVLDTGAVIADIPGIDDNVTRVDPMQRYLSVAQELIIVTHLDNIFVDDINTLEEIGYEGVTFLDGRSRGVIVTTHLDEYTPEKAKAWFKKNKQFKDTFDEVSADLRHAQNQVSHASRANHPNDKIQMECNIKRHERRLSEVCSLILDDFIEPQAIEAFGRTIQTDDITWRVFRVDPIRYMELKADGSTFAARMRKNRNVEQLFELQEYIGAMTYSRQYRLAMARLVESQRIVANLLFWSSAAVRLPPAAQAVVGQTVRRTLTSLEAEMLIVRQELTTNISSALAQILTQAEVSTFEAIEKTKRKIIHAKEPLTTVRMICRGGGEIEGGINWNSYLLEDLREEMCTPWKNTITYLVQMVTTFQVRFCGSIEGIENLLEKNLDEQGMNPILRTAFKNIFAKELEGSCAQVVEICRNAVREAHHMFR
ncbi:hypothetical protein TWF730_000285 [Orbilia blumenaviensis]|uniref:Uncharacterized protein n=1 Tax=Orbilia blumenaviensis TaxID=1796055 RepID=A0AAV9VLE3_9PEZI